MVSEPAGRSGLRGSLEALLGVPGVVGAVLATDDGLPLAAHVREDLDEEALAAAAAVLGQLGAKASADGGLGSLRFVGLDASKLRFMVEPVALGHLLALSDYSADVEQVLPEMHRSALELDEAARAMEDSLAADPAAR